MLEYLGGGGSGFCHWYIPIGSYHYSRARSTPSMRAPEDPFGALLATARRYM
jgi:hypothetical protein